MIDDRQKNEPNQWMLAFQPIGTAIFLSGECCYNEILPTHFPFSQVSKCNYGPTVVSVPERGSGLAGGRQSIWMSDARD
jgi:hypothetical protein